MISTNIVYSTNSMSELSKYFLICLIEDFLRPLLGCNKEFLLNVLKSWLDPILHLLVLAFHCRIYLLLNIISHLAKLIQKHTCLFFASFIKFETPLFHVSYRCIEFELESTRRLLNKLDVHLGRTTVAHSLHWHHSTSPTPAALHTLLLHCRLTWTLG